MEQQADRRIGFIDLTKGLCIMLVVMMHVGGAFDGLAAGPVLSSFTMPLYFFVSGLFFKSYEGFGGFLARKVDKLLVPFLIFYLGSFLLMYGISKALPGTFRLPVRWSELLLVFRGHELIRFTPPIWFLVALFNCNILFYLVHYLRRKHIPTMFVVTLLIGAAGFWLGKQRIELPFYIDVAMTRKLQRNRRGFTLTEVLLALAILIILLALVTMYFTATPLGMRTNNYPGNFVQVYLAAFAGIFAIMLLCKKVKKAPVVTYLGRFSVITLGIHGPLLFFLRPLVSHFLHNEWVQSIVLLLLTLGVCLLLTPLIVRMIPQFAAQKLLAKSGSRE